MPDKLRLNQIFPPQTKLRMSGWVRGLSQTEKSWICVSDSPAIRLQCGQGQLKTSKKTEDGAHTSGSKVCDRF